MRIFDRKAIRLRKHMITKNALIMDSYNPGNLRGMQLLFPFTYYDYVTCNKGNTFEKLFSSFTMKNLIFAVKN